MRGHQRLPTPHWLTSQRWIRLRCRSTRSTSRSCSLHLDMRPTTLRRRRHLGTGDGGCDVPGFNGPGAGSLGNCIGQYQGTPTLPGNEWILSGKVDYNMSDKDHLSWRYRMDHGTQATSADFYQSAFSRQPASSLRTMDRDSGTTYSVPMPPTSSSMQAATTARSSPSRILLCSRRIVFGYGFNLTGLGGTVASTSRKAAT